MPPLGKMPRDVQNAHEDVKLDDALLKVDIHSRVPTSDVLLLDDVGSVLKIVLLHDDVDKVNGQNDVDVVDFPTVLDEQGDVEVSLCDLL